MPNHQGSVCARARTLLSEVSLSVCARARTFGLLYPPMKHLFNCEMHSFTLQAKSVNA